MERATLCSNFGSGIPIPGGDNRKRRRLEGVSGKGQLHRLCTAQEHRILGFNALHKNTWSLNRFFVAQMVRV